MSSNEKFYVSAPTVGYTYQTAYRANLPMYNTKINREQILEYLKRKQLQSDEYAPAKTEEQSMSTGKKVAIAAGIVTAFAIVGDALFCKGKHVKNILGKFKGAKSKLDVKPELKPKVNLEVKPEIRPAVRSEVNPDVKPEVKPVVRSEVNPDVKPEVKPVVRSEVNPDVKPEVKPAVRSEVNPDVKPEVKPAVRSEVNPDVKPEVKPDVKSVTQSTTKVESKAKGVTQEPQSIPNDDAKILKKQKEFERKMAFSRDFVQNNMDELDNILLDANGYLTSANGAKIKIEELFKPYKGELKELYHGTTAENKCKILTEGFSQKITPQHGHLDGIGGTYFTTYKTDKYGDSVVVARFEGKVAEVDTDMLNDIKLLIENRFKVDNLLNAKGHTGQSAEYIISEYLKQKLFNLGYQGIIGTNFSFTAGCNYFSALKPELIKIIS